MDPPIPLLWACAAIFIAVAARQKGRSGAAWLFLGIIVGPLAFIALLVLPKLGQPAPWPTHYAFALTSYQKWWLSLIGVLGIYAVFLFEIWRSQFL
jgi:predicted cobalt transporter CbtA